VTPTPVTKVMLADDHTLVRAGVRKILEGHPGFSVVGEVADGRSRKYFGLLNSCAASFEPTTLPSRLIRLPSALFSNATWAKPVITAG